MNAYGGPRSIVHLLWMFAGPLVWFLHFSLIYGAETWACAAPGAADARMYWLGAIVTAAALVALAGAALRQARNGRDGGETGRFLRATSLALTGLSLLAVVFTTLALAAIGPCIATAG